MTITEVVGAITMPSVTPDVTLEAPTEVTALASLGAMTVVGTVDGAFVADDELSAVENFSDGGPASIASVALAARRSSSVLVVADNGWFHTSASSAQLIWSPASDAFMDLDIVDVSSLGAGADEKIWFAAEQGLHLLQAGALSRWAVVGEEAAASAVMATADRVFAAFGGTLYEITTSDKSVTRVLHDFGAIVDVAPGLDGVVFVASDQGLFRRDDATSYTHFTLADGAARTAVTATAFDPQQGLYALTADGVLLAGADSPAGVVELAASAVSVDDFGRVWLAQDGALSGFDLGTPLSFDSDIKPILDGACMSCHAEPGSNAAPPIDFTDYATAVSYVDDILQRVSNGTMPPPGEGEISAQQLELIVRWQSSGMSP